MSEVKDVISIDEAKKAVRDMTRRVGLLHMAYARTLVDEFGEEKGRELIENAIWAYGTKIGEKTRQTVEALGLEPTVENFNMGSDLSPLGFDFVEEIVEGEVKDRVVACPLAEVWHEYGENKLGGLYCFVDPAKMQAYDPNWTLIHTKKLPDGDEFCEIEVRSVEDEGS